MVWFQCEDCGENLKKPKLPNHFRMCSATKLSCIDCGQTFGQQSVQGHTQCITEAEKYGPKGQGKVAHPAAAKTNNDSKKKPDVDINVGLSQRAPWFCSLCNTKATSQQALLLHADGKKHRAKARAIQAANQQPKPTEDSTPAGNVSTEDRKDELPGNKDVEKPKQQDQPNVAPVSNGSEAEKVNLLQSKKRKHDVSENGGAMKRIGVDTSGELGNGEVIQVERVEDEEPECQVKKAKKSALKEEKKRSESNSAKEDSEKKIKWKKLITSVLKTNPAGVLKMRKLRKLVLEALRESGTAKDEMELGTVLEEKINSSSRFTVDGKYVHLVAKS